MNTEKKLLLVWSKMFLTSSVIILTAGLGAIFLMSAISSLSGGTMDGVRVPFFDGVIFGILAFFELPLLFLFSFLVCASNKRVNPYVLGATAFVFVLIGIYSAASINSYTLNNFLDSWNAGSVLGTIFGKPSNLILLGLGILLNFLVFRFRKSMSD